MAVNASHAVMQQNIRRAGGARTAIGSDHAVGGKRHLELFGLEPFVEKFRSALGEDLHQADDFDLRQSS